MPSSATTVAIRRLTLPAANAAKRALESLAVTENEGEAGDAVE